MISLTATFVLPARQTLIYKYSCFSSPGLPSCCIYAICCMVFLIPMENTSDFSLQRQCTAICTTEPELWIFGEPKEFGNRQVRKVRSVEHPYNSAWYDIWSAPTKPSLGHTTQLTEHRMRHCSTPWCERGQHAWKEALWNGLISPCCIPSWKGCTETKEADGVKSCPNYVNRSIVIVFSGARLPLQGTCQKIPILICIFLFQDEN